MAKFTCGICDSTTNLAEGVPVSLICQRCGYRGRDGLHFEGEVEVEPVEGAEIPLFRIRTKTHEADVEPVEPPKFETAQEPDQSEDSLQESEPKEESESKPKKSRKRIPSRKS